VDTSEIQLVNNVYYAIASVATAWTALLKAVSAVLMGATYSNPHVHSLAQASTTVAQRTSASLVRALAKSATVPWRTTANYAL